MKNHRVTNDNAKIDFETNNERMLGNGLVKPCVMLQQEEII